MQAKVYEFDSGFRRAWFHRGYAAAECGAVRNDKMHVVGASIRAALEWTAASTPLRAGEGGCPHMNVCTV
jgi:hypothetical protein